MVENRVLLRMEGIEKRFPGVHALENVDLDLYAGEVHVLLGENGAGKSTLMKIISGSLERDSGKLWVDGNEIGNLNPEHSQNLGIGMVYQELSLCPNLSVAENIFIGNLPKTKIGKVDWQRLTQMANESLDSLTLSINPKELIGNLPVAEQQMIEIARVFNKNPKILILDEPTSALSDAERDRLFELIRLLQKRGVGIIYISHRLAEIKMIGTRVTVMRDGKIIGTTIVKDSDENQLIQMMVGKNLEDQFPKEKAEIGDVIFEVNDLCSENEFEGINFQLHTGEILGIFGLMGAGQAQLARALLGLGSMVSGEVIIDNHLLRKHTPNEAIKHGMGLLTRDRREGLISMLEVPQNITLAIRSQESMSSLIKLRDEKKIADDYVKSLQITPPITDRKVMYFSGGNQQKIVLARWLCSKSKVLIFDEPTRGIDVSGKADVFRLMCHLANQGVGIIMISSEMQEILAMADRILVMRQGKIVAELDEGATQEDLLRNASEF
ncbi:MAG TPA: ABC transporter ATP-binding protein [Anaerolineaceae bacterium]|nr:ABC transporter ATP-binding protein [Anaerolineaceae bacterium]